MTMPIGPRELRVGAFLNSLIIQFLTSCGSHELKVFRFLALSIKALAQPSISTRALVFINA